MKEKIIHPPTVFVISILLEVFIHFFFPFAKIIPAEFKNFGVILIILSSA